MESHKSNKVNKRRKMNQLEQKLIAEAKMKEVVFRQNHPCPDCVRRHNRLDQCSLNDKVCILVTHDWCDTYEDYIFETWQEDET